MKSYRKNLFVFILVGTLLAGCSRPIPQPDPPRFVTRVDVQCQREGKFLQRQYTDEKKMSSVLNYIRLLESGGGLAAEPEDIPGDDYQIVVYLSDGTRRTYRQRADQYLSRDSLPWVKIDPRRGRQLYPILETLESDGL